MAWLSSGERYEMKREYQPPADSSKPSEKYTPSRRPTFKPKERIGDPYTNKESKSPMLLKNPDNIKTQTELDTTQDTYQITEKAGELDYRPPTEMNFKDYSNWRNDQMSKSYWKSKGAASGDAGNNSPISAKPKGLNPRIQMPPVFDRIFGGNYIDIKPNGMVMLDFGGQYQKTNNPAIPIRQQRNGGFRFDQQISFNMVGKVGERLTIRANWDTKATFDFDNNIKIEYKALEQDIIKRVELGNVSMPTSSSLIQGAQNLFGIKAQLQFGRLSVTAVAANQRSKVDELIIPGGAAGPGREYEQAAALYDSDRHYWLSQFFYENYDDWMRSSPYITSQLAIGKVEIYVTNRNNTTDNLRNITCFTDLGEAQPANKDPNKVSPDPFFIGQNGRVADNRANTLYSLMNENSSVRNSDLTQNTLSNTLGYQTSIDYEIIRGARKLEENRDFKVNRQLGYISLTTQLRNDDVLGVAFEYKYKGSEKQYQVGELSQDYATRTSKETIYLKLLRNAIPNSSTRYPIWNLMMKNIYQLPTTNVSRNGFQLRVIYKDDKTGIDNPYIQEGEAVDINTKLPRPADQSKLKEFPLVRLFNVDNLNPNGDPAPDGNWDYASGVTIDTANGRAIFGVRKPFGQYFQQFFDTVSESNLINKYVFNELYDQPQANAKLLTAKNKFFLKGRFQSGSSQEIQLQGLNIAQGSVRVLSGSTQLVEGQDYTINYELGRVRITNPGILTSGNDIVIRFEKADLFNFRQKSMLGTRLDYKINRDFNIGGTFMHLRERPLITRVAYGDDPLFNTMWGMDVSYSKESRFLTRMVDALPLIQTKEPSAIAFKGEVAQLLPGTPPQIGKGDNANVFIDDFEGAETPYDLTRNPTKWCIGSPPSKSVYTPFYDPAALEKNPQSYSYKRAKMSWYNIDPTVFYQNGAQKPGNITDDEIKNHYVRAIGPQEIYPNRSLQAGVANETTLDLAYFPDERGPYNYNPNITTDGKLPRPQENFASVTRAVTFDTDFDNANIQYIDFWLMDPFLSGTHGNLNMTVDNNENAKIDNSQNPGGELWFHLGSVSEDVEKDGKQAFENGLPIDGNIATGVEENDWGRVTTTSYINNAFSNAPGARENQDLGLDGLRSSDEASYGAYKTFLDKVNLITDDTKKQSILEDVSNDDFRHYLSVNSKNILDRYHRYNGMENNSSTSTQNGYIQSNTNIPDNEDLNQNNTVSDLEQYFEFRIPIKRGRDGLMDQAGNGYVISSIVNDINGEKVPWYQIRVPIRTNPTSVNQQADFKSIRFVRMVMTGWQKPVVLRMAQLQLVGSLWRPMDTVLVKQQIDYGDEPRLKSKVQVSTVNIEENAVASNGGTPYVVPPGFIRDRDNTSNLNRVQNEQSLRICTDDLLPGEYAPAYKLFSINLLNSKRIRMFLHAESNTAADYEMRGFLRLGTDFNQNYYDIQIPLKLTPPGTTNPDLIWPEENALDLELEDLSYVKAERIKAGVGLNQIFTMTVNGRIISIKGNPDYTSVQTALIGIYNPKENAHTGANQMCIWADELRSSGFNKSPGWAAVGTLNAKLADLANVTASGTYKSAGFGPIDQKISQRQQSTTTQFGANTNIAMDKFIPANVGLKVPVYVSYDRKVVRPLYDPTNPDLKLSTSLNAIQDEEARIEKENSVIDQSTRRSISLNNLQKTKTDPNKKTRLYSIENFTLSLGYNDIRSSNYLTQLYFFKNYKVGLGYNYGANPKSIEPLKGVKTQSKYVQFITAFNFTLLPSNLSFRTDLDRRYAVTQLRAGDLSAGATAIPMYEKSYFLNRSYGLRWAFTKSLGMDYRANVAAIVDEPMGEINNDLVNKNDPNSISKRDSVRKNLQKLGRIKNFDQSFIFTYRTPLDKIPFLDWTQADLNYTANYIWKAGAIGYSDTLGNQMQNSRIIGVNGKLDLLKLYNKLKFLKEINTPLSQLQQARKQKKDQWTKELENPKLTAEEKDSLRRLINKVHLSEVRPVRGLFQVLMLIKNFNLTYEKNDATGMPGFKPKPKYMGLSEVDMAPGIPFILGSQDIDAIKADAIEKEWISSSPYQSNPLLVTRSTKITYRTSLEPFKQFRIQLDGRQEETQSYTEYFRADTLGNIQSQNPVRMGTFKTSYITALTAFAKDDPVTNKNANFEQFTANTDIIRERLLKQREGGIGTYDTSSQEVLIPAFLAAYSGTDANKVALSAFPKIPLPNWRIDYGGLSSVGVIKRYFSSVNLSHSYTSTYMVNNYTSSAKYGRDFVSPGTSVFNVPLGDSINNQGVYVPVYVISAVSIQEAFTPLLGINMKTKNNMTFNIRYNYTRNLNLSATNAQVMEMTKKDWTVSVGYTKTGMKLPIKYKQRTIVLKNETTFRLDFTLSDGSTVQRRINDINVITQGIQQIQIKPTINYRVNDRLSLQIYYDQTITTPKVSNSFKRTNTLFGIQIRFSLS